MWQTITISSESQAILISTHSMVLHVHLSVVLFYSQARFIQYVTVLFVYFSVKVTPEGVQAIVTLANGDMRKSLNILQVSITQVAIIFPVFFRFQKDKLNRVDFERSSLFRVCSVWHIHILLALLKRI